MPNKPPLYKPTRPAAQFGLRQETERKLRKVAGVIMPATFRASEQYMGKHPSKHLPDQSAAVLADWSLSGKDVAVPSPPSRPQAKQRCVSISGSGAKAPVGAGQSPAARRVGAGFQRAEPFGAACGGHPPLLRVNGEAGNIKQNTHFGKLDEQCRTAIREERQRRAGHRENPGHNEQVHQRLDRKLG